MGPKGRRLESDSPEILGVPLSVGSTSCGVQQREEDNADRAENFLTQFDLRLAPEQDQAERRQQERGEADPVERRRRHEQWITDGGAGFDLVRCWLFVVRWRRAQQ